MLYFYRILIIVFTNTSFHFSSYSLSSLTEKMMAPMTMNYIGHSYDIETVVDKVGVSDALKSSSPSPSNVTLPIR